MCLGKIVETTNKHNKKKENEENVSGAKLAIAMPVWLPGHCLCECWGQKTPWDFSTCFMVQQGKMVHLITYNLHLSSTAHNTKTLLLHTQLYYFVLVV